MEKQRAKFFPQKYSYQKKLIVLLVKSINNINWRLKVVIALCKLFILSFTFKKKRIIVCMCRRNNELRSDQSTAKYVK